METITIELPASTYVKLYNIYGEGTREQINNILINSEIGEKLASESVLPANEAPTSFRPGPNTITGRVWEIADRLKSETGEANRDAVVRTCMEEGINLNTASTQYSQWKKENG